MTELASVEDQSPNGVRLATERAWELGAHIVLKSVAGNLQNLKARARVVYCNTLGPRQFVVGLNILSREKEPAKPFTRKLSIVVPSDSDRVAEIISASHTALCDTVVARLALGVTYCKTAKLAKGLEKRRRLVARACEALSIAERYMEAARPEELSSKVGEAAKRLRSAIGELTVDSLSAPEPADKD